MKGIVVVIRVHKLVGYGWMTFMLKDFFRNYQHFLYNLFVFKSRKTIHTTYHQMLRANPG